MIFFKLCNRMADLFRTFAEKTSSMSKEKERGPGLMRKYVWVLDTILRHHKITFRELNELWVDGNLSGGKDLPKRTFDNWCNAIEDIFDIDIENEQGGDYRYYIKDEREFRRDERRIWLFNTFNVINALGDCQRIKDRILLEYVPSGEQHLQPITEAMKEGRVLNITYQSYWNEEENDFDVQPYCVKLFKQRWYMVARSTDPYYYKKGPFIYSLDRIRSLRTKDETFKMPEDWSAEEFFKGCFGIIVEQKVKVQPVKLKVSAGQANYIRDLKLHKSQEEIERNEEYSIFRYRLRPSFDFIQELLWNGSDMEVLEPLWLRDEVAKIVEQMWKKYKMVNGK